MPRTVAVARSLGEVEHEDGFRDSCDRGQDGKAPYANNELGSDVGKPRVFPEVGPSVTEFGKTLGVLCAMRAVPTFVFTIWCFCCTRSFIDAGGCFAGSDSITAQVELAIWTVMNRHCREPDLTRR